MTEKEYLEFKNLISMGDELNFYYKNDEYWISHIQDKSFFIQNKRFLYSRVLWTQRAF